jgi:hypothetical protein
MDIVEVNPSLGNDSEVKITCEVAVDLAKTALGYTLV